MEYVYVASPGLVTRAPHFLHLSLNEIYRRDDPFVVANPDLFSETPLVVSSTIGKPAPTPAPLRERGAGEQRDERGGRPRRG